LRASQDRTGATCTKAGTSSSTASTAEASTAQTAMTSVAQRRIRTFCGRAFATVLPPGKPERESDKVCQPCALPPPPDGRD
jgi:hypothetical protein